ncbi:MAG: hypothetical protein Q8P57_05120 [Candidatus Pacearchaeota archaeon]|nr:hypothetical protein [Candidatus Pacearchaeota archaeon]
MGGRFFRLFVVGLVSFVFVFTLNRFPKVYYPEAFQGSGLPFGWGYVFSYHFIFSLFVFVFLFGVPLIYMLIKRNSAKRFWVLFWFAFLGLFLMIIAGNIMTEVCPNPEVIFRGTSVPAITGSGEPSPDMYVGMTPSLQIQQCYQIFYVFKQGGILPNWVSLFVLNFLSVAFIAFAFYKVDNSRINKKKR